MTLGPPESRGPEAVVVVITPGSPELTQRLFARYELPVDANVLDAGCGTGEISFRLAEMFPKARVLGVDIIEDHLARGRVRCAGFGERVGFENRSVFELELPNATFDLVVCRHVLQAIPHADRVLAELIRVTRPGGWLHLIAEDYLMIHFEARRLDPDDFWSVGPRRFGQATGTDLRIGRSVFRILRGLGLSEISVDYVVVDTTRVPRERFIEHFDDMIATIRDENGYGVWHVPVVAARVP